MLFNFCPYYFCTYYKDQVLYQEEKLEPLKNVNDDPRIRLLNRLYAKKRKELKEQQKLKVVTSASLAKNPGSHWRYVLNM